ncbi:flagellar brake protein [Rubeoparvulum massiliense]|uniref:flagellar brake protein n=1 Tax=Rubeoparvulum massiliense TaxID=1631346 RepID=UPI00065E59B3|nr:flagellar brake domain-containing protein [Rubeoparvulum massiliense]
MYPEINQILFLQPMEENGAKQSENLLHKTRVADCTEDQLLIEMPIAERTGKMKWFPNGTPLIVWYFGHDGSKYIFHTRVIGRRNENIALMVLALPALDTISRVQRRNFVRVPAETEVAFHLVQRSEVECLTHTLDVSGGGFACWCDEKMPIREHDLIDGWLLLPLHGQVQHAHFTGEVVRIIPPAEKGLKRKISVKITKVSEKDQTFIVRYCFERQLEMRELER